MDRFSTRLAAGLMQDRHREAAAWLHVAESTQPSLDRASTSRGPSFHGTRVRRGVLAMAAVAGSIRQAR